MIFIYIRTPVQYRLYRVKMGDTFLSCFSSLTAIIMSLGGWGMVELFKLKLDLVSFPKSSYADEGLAPLAIFPLSTQQSYSWSISTTERQNNLWNPLLCMMNDARHLKINQVFKRVLVCHQLYWESISTRWHFYFLCFPCTLIFMSCPQKSPNRE